MFPNVAFFISYLATQNFSLGRCIVKRITSIPDYGITSEMGGAFWGSINDVTVSFVVKAEQQWEVVVGRMVSLRSCSRKDGKRSKSVWNSRETIIFFGCIRIKAKTLLEIVGIEPGTNSYKLNTITNAFYIWKGQGVRVTSESSQLRTQWSSLWAVNQHSR